MKEAFLSEIVGNGELKKRLFHDVSENHLSHAYILEGARGSGRHTVARQVAAAIECERRDEGGMPDLFGSLSPARLPCGECPSCRKILEGKSPDVITVGLPEDRVTIGVESIRSLKDDMFTAPNDLSVKVYIIEDADLMTEQAQNAFLLSLEEPPEYILFFLLCQSSEALLETVRSRAPTLRMQWIEREEMANYLLSHDPRAKALCEEDPKAWQALLAVAQGSIGYAVELLDSKTRSRVFELRDDARALVSLLSASRKSAVFEAMKAFGTKRNEISGKLTLIQYALRDLLLLKRSDEVHLCFFEDRDDAQELASHFTLSGLLALYDSTVVAKDDLDAGANTRLALTSMMQRAGLI